MGASSATWKALISVARQLGRVIVGWASVGPIFGPSLCRSCLIHRKPLSDNLVPMEQSQRFQSTFNLKRILQCLQRYHAPILFQSLDEIDLISAIQMKRKKKKTRLKLRTSPSYSLPLFPFSPPNLFSPPPQMVVQLFPLLFSHSFPVLPFPLICSLLHSFSIVNRVAVPPPILSPISCFPPT